ncbi:DNA alkylation repair protein [Salinibius halmophilus]|uniref:DNA alkylation repair protein n=1 Tax=Salinibius halmophilus TaxID=1853216 RepID=UPI000E66769B|nr:DNA alkylation repair protein [Salinibius halmophilus]
MTLYDFLAQHSNAENAHWMRKYLRDQYDFFGIKTPQRKALVKQYCKQFGAPCDYWQLWQQDKREMQYAVIDLLDRQKQLPETMFAEVERLVLHKSWWDTIDPLAVRTVGKLAQQHDAREWIAKWRTSEDFWLRRVCLLFQLKYKQHTDVALLHSLIAENQSSDEFFIQKAIGWAIRELSKTNPTAAKEILHSCELSPLSVREGKKYL